MKESIIQAAVTEIGYRGLKFSIRDVTARLGMSTKTLYQHFSSKEALVSAIIQQSVQEMRAMERRIREDETLSLREKLRQSLAVLPVGLAFKDLRMLDELRTGYPKAWGYADEYMREGWDGIRQLIEEGVQSGEVKPFNFEIFMQMYIGSLYRLTEYVSVSRHDGLTLQEALGEIVDILLSGIIEERRME
ncbi:TetR/AcrR family transcriptional regulator [Paenibacillus lentus]|uniref:TetR/AcrR family transcriptional regulator n=1 Tax=Paenibacillus lentus TaxID=1338368 RepID=A0A3S8RQG0_9BACL|nr:TetR/AcrR family transcriptional regulator [Paenibacillus lentus]AZK45214.1 TetR/AcrR family transcriptional regulator [Paenibacillus lentus]